jgi:hypothetical protein
MPDDANPGNSDSNMTRRMLHLMALAVGVAVGASLPVATWRVTTGLLLGGMLSLLNFHWMRSSVGAAFSVIAGGAKPQFGLSKYVLRYAIIAGVVYAAYAVNVVSLPATIIGLTSFVVALFAEALRESYLIFTHREGIN